LFEARVQCPRCGQIWTVKQGMPEAECNCHLWCDRGTRAADCNLTSIDSQTVNWGYPANMDVGSYDEGEDVIRRKAYCNTHEIYSYREPIILEVDWEKWRDQKRLPNKLKLIQTRR
jgi:hypothetical protein